MGVKETNRVSAIGILPYSQADPIPVGKIPYGGTQIAKSATGNNTTPSIHKVNTGKTLYLTAITFSVRNFSEATASGIMAVNDDEAVEQYRLFRAQAPVGGGHAAGLSFMPPLEIPEDWTILILSAAAGVEVTGFIHGYEA